MLVRACFSLCVRVHACACVCFCVHANVLWLCVTLSSPLSVPALGLVQSWICNGDRYERFTQLYSGGWYHKQDCGEDLSITTKMLESFGNVSKQHALPGTWDMVAVCRAQQA